MWFGGPYDCLFHLEFFDCLPPSLYVFVTYDPSCNLWVFDIVRFPPTFIIVFVYFFALLLRSTHSLEDHLLYWLSIFLSILVINANGGGKKFREFSLVMHRGFFFYYLSIYILYACIIALHVCAWLCLFTYIKSL